MAIESAGFISELVATNPPGADDLSTADDHLRLIKAVLKAQFPNFTTAAIDASVAELNVLTRMKSAIKTSDETVNNSTTLQNDDDLAVTGLVAGKIYRVHAVIIMHNAVSAANFKAFFTPTGGAATGRLMWTFYDGFTAVHVVKQSTSFSAGVALDTGGTSVNLLVVDGVFLSSTATGLKFQWAQNVATVGDTVVEQDSILQLIPLN